MRSDGTTIPHQIAEPIRFWDEHRNFYDRYYFNLHASSGGSHGDGLGSIRPAVQDALRGPRNGATTPCAPRACRDRMDHPVGRAASRCSRGLDSACASARATSSDRATTWTCAIRVPRARQYVRARAAPSIRCGLPRGCWAGTRTVDVERSRSARPLWGTREPLVGRPAVGEQSIRALRGPEGHLTAVELLAHAVRRSGHPLLLNETDDDAACLGSVASGATRPRCECLVRHEYRQCSLRGQHHVRCSRSPFPPPRRSFRTPRRARAASRDRTVTAWSPTGPRQYRASWSWGVPGQGFDGSRAFGVVDHVARSIAPPQRRLRAP